MNLRDAIAEVIVREDSPEQTAAALIAEFGLTVERRGVSGALPAESRIVGEWRTEEPESPVDAAVESSARALYAHVHRNMPGDVWENASSALRDEYRSMAVAAANGASEAEPETPARTPRLRACVDAWPDCETGGYDPRCCRFPKACSCTAYDSTRVWADDLEEL